MWMIHRIFSKVLSFLFPSSCYGCKLPGVALCISCLSLSKKSFDSPYPFIYPIYSFREPLIRKTIHAIKYFNRKDLVVPFGEILGNELIKNNLQGTLVPIPMHPLRLLLRG